MESDSGGVSKIISIHFPGGSAVENPPTMQETQEMQVLSPSQEDPLEKETIAHSSILQSAESYGQRSLLAIVHGVAMSWSQLSN